MTWYLVAEALVSKRVAIAGAPCACGADARECHSRQRDQAACLLVPAYVAT